MHLLTTKHLIADILGCNVAVPVRKPANNSVRKLFTGICTLHRDDVRLMRILVGELVDNPVVDLCLFTRVGITDHRNRGVVPVEPFQVPVEIRVTEIVVKEPDIEIDVPVLLGELETRVLTEPDQEP